jgi:hypothetical protein
MLKGEVRKHAVRYTHFRQAALLRRLREEVAKGAFDLAFEPVSAPVASDHAQDFVNIIIVIGIFPMEKT